MDTSCTMSDRGRLVLFVMSDAEPLPSSKQHHKSNLRHESHRNRGSDKCGGGKAERRDAKSLGTPLTNSRDPVETERLRGAVDI